MAESLVVKISADLSGLDAGIKEATNTVSSFGDVLKGSFLGGLGANLATTAFATLTSAVTDAFHALAEVDKISGQTAAVIKSTGGAAGVTADQVATLADQLERKTGIEAESIQRGQNLLLTFTNIKDAAGANNDIFTQATKIMADLGTAMGTDASGAAIQLGKALNDPTAGITALTRVGVTFTDAQKAQIKALQESGNMMAAQKIILAELNKEFGGSAAAAGQTFAGALNRVANGLGSITEAMLTPAVPAFTAALGKLADASYAVSDAITRGNFIGLINDAFGPGPKALVLGLASAIGVAMVQSMQTASRQAMAMAATYARAAAAMVVANAPVLAAFAAISFAAYPFIKNWDHVKGLFGTIWETMAGVVNRAMTAIGGFSKAAWETISGHFRTAYANFVATFITPVGKAFTALFDALPDKVKSAIGGIDFKMPNLGLDTTAISASFESVKQAAMPAINVIKDGFKIAADNFYETWGDLPGQVSGAMNHIMGTITGSSAKMAGSLKTVSNAAADMGEGLKAGHEKAAKGAKTHADQTDKFAGVLFGLERKLWATMTAANALKDKIYQLKWAKLQKEVEEYVKAQGEMEQPLVTAAKRISDMDKAAKFWGDTTDRSAEKMTIWRDAINQALSLGIDPLNMKLETAKQKHDELGASQQAASAKSADFGSALHGVGDAITAIAGTFTFFGGSDSPVVGFLAKVTEAIGLFDTWVQGIKGVGMAIQAFSGMGAVIGSLLLPVTLIAAGIGLIIWAVKDAVEAFGGWPKVFDTLTIGWQKFGLVFAQVGEALVGGVINWISASWTGLVNGIKIGANFIIDAVNKVIEGINVMLSALPKEMGGGNQIGLLQRFALEEFKPIQIDFTSKLKADIEQTQARLDQAPAMKEWRVSNPIADITNAIQGAMATPEAEKGKAQLDSTFKQIATLEKQAAIFGDTADLAKGKMDILKRSMEDMLKDGIDESNASFQKLRSEYNMLKGQADSTNTVMADLAKTMRNLDSKALVVGDSAALQADRQAALQSAMIELTNKGFGPMSDEMQTLKRQFDAITAAKAPELSDAQKNYLSGYNATIQRALERGDEAEAKRIVAEAEAAKRAMLGQQAGPRRYGLQSLASDLREPMGGQGPVVNVNYNGSGKWTREDAQQLGALIVTEVKAAGVR